MTAGKPALWTPGDWNALADKLGVEVTEPAAPARKKAPESDYGGPSSESLEASLAEIEPIESMFEEIIEDEVSDIEFESDDDSDLDDDDSELDEEEDDDSDLDLTLAQQLTRQELGRDLDAFTGDGIASASRTQQPPHDQSVE